MQVCRARICRTKWLKSLQRTGQGPMWLCLYRLRTFQGPHISNSRFWGFAHSNSFVLISADLGVWQKGRVSRWSIALDVEGRSRSTSQSGQRGSWGVKNCLARHKKNGWLMRMCHWHNRFGLVKQEFWIPWLLFSGCLRSQCQRWCYICGLQLLEVWSSLLISEAPVGRSVYLLASWVLSNYIYSIHVIPDMRTPSKKLLLWSHWMPAFCGRSMRTCLGQSYKTFAVRVGTFTASKKTKLFCIWFESFRTLNVMT